MTNKLTSRGDGNAFAIGDGAVAIAGDVNLTLPAKSRLTPSLAEKLLSEFVRIELPVDFDFSFDLPAPLMEKLNYNNAPVFQDIFNNHQDDYLALEQAIRNFPNSSRVKKRVCDLFYSIRESNRTSDGSYNGDVVLQEMREVLCNDMAAASNLKVDETIYMETIDGFCISLLEWCVMDCKVLENPSTRSSEDQQC